KFPPLALFTNRDGSYFIVHSGISLVLNCPQASLNGTHTTILGKLCKASMMFFHSFLYMASDSGLRCLSCTPFDILPGCISQMFPPRSPLGISCQTKIPILSQCLYQRAGSTLMCLRIILNPISFVFSTSNFNASSDGAVCRPSGHQPWSNGP